MNYGTCNLYFSDASRIPQMFFCKLTCLINLKNTQMLRIFFFSELGQARKRCARKNDSAFNKFRKKGLTR